MMKKTSKECVLRKHPIISESRNTKADLSLFWVWMNEEATEKKTKVRVNNIKKESEDISLSVTNSKKCY